MKGKDIFEFVGDIGTDDSDFDFSGFDFSDEVNDDPVDRIFFPSQLTISDESFVDLVTNSQIIKSGKWKEVHQYITDNWSNFNGTYSIAQSGQVLHTFRVARQD